MLVKRDPKSRILTRDHLIRQPLISRNLAERTRLRKFEK